MIDSGANIVFRVQTRDLTPTFGSPLGAQLVDVYVHDPGAQPPTSTAAILPTAQLPRSHPAFAWSRLIEVQGFGQRYVDAHGTTLGTVTITRQRDLALHHLQRAEVVARHARLGLGLHRRAHRPGRVQPDQARSFASTPQPFQFGVCATASSDPHCTADPNSVPKAMDVITPAGVSQSDELDYTLHSPVVLQGVTIP